MIIALDLDGTYSKDPDMWDAFIDLARVLDHQVICVTFRKNGDVGGQAYQKLKDKIGEDNIFFTDHEYKMDFMESIPYHVDVWIDDEPHYITGIGHKMYKENGD